MKHAVVGVIAVISSALAQARPAVADQCQALPQAQVRAAVKLFPKGDRFVRMCEPCGETTAGPVEPVDKAWIDGNGTTFELHVNESAVDLAYSFLVAPDGKALINAALLSGCKTTGVSGRILTGARSTPPDSSQPLDGADVVITDEDREERIR